MRNLTRPTENRRFKHARNLALLVLLGLNANSYAATEISACDSDDSQLGLLNIPDSRLTIRPVDYETDKADKKVDDTESLVESSTLDTSRISLTPGVDTTVTRGILLQSELELPDPVKSGLASDADPAALLLERRAVDALENASDDNDEAPVSTRLPGVEDETLLEYRKKMFRTDI